MSQRINGELTDTIHFAPMQNIPKWATIILSMIGIRYVKMDDLIISSLYPLKHFRSTLNLGLEKYDTGVYFVFHDPYNEIQEVTTELLLDKKVVYIGQTATLYDKNKTQGGVTSRLNTFACDLLGMNTHHSGGMKRMVADHELENYKACYIANPDDFKFDSTFSYAREQLFLTEYLERWRSLPVCNKI